MFLLTVDFLLVPTKITTWEWAFESEEFSPICQNRTEALGGYSNAITEERLDFAAVKEKATKLSTVLVRKYGLAPHQTVSLFSTNTIWYPVVMWAAVRVGESLLLFGLCAGGNWCTS